MENTPQEERELRHTQRSLSASKFVLIAFLIIIGYFLFTEHLAHTIAFLPYLFLLACPLMHLFMHGGHHGHHDHHEQREHDDKKGDR
ncbi:MAG: DUF2933 domain-containing protein [Burkholderiales bacterium]|nr:DUF2933 domain-containing protein [Burkholderiales bacterium]